MDLMDYWPEKNVKNHSSGEYCMVHQTGRGHATLIEAWPRV